MSNIPRRTQAVCIKEVREFPGDVAVAVEGGGGAAKGEWDLFLRKCTTAELYPGKIVIIKPVQAYVKDMEEHKWRYWEVVK